MSIARRLQDPLAELIKIDPKSIGVGQYQHDMPENRLSTVLGGTVIDCVNTVGVDLNTASVSLLSYVAGLNSAIAKNIVEYREKYGKFQNRKELLKVLCGGAFYVVERGESHLVFVREKGDSRLIVVANRGQERQFDVPEGVCYRDLISGVDYVDFVTIPEDSAMILKEIVVEA